MIENLEKRLNDSILCYIFTIYSLLSLSKKNSQKNTFNYLLYFFNLMILIKTL